MVTVRSSSRNRDLPEHVFIHILEAEAGGEGRAGSETRLKALKPSPRDIIPLPNSSITSPSSIPNWEPGIQILWETFLICTTPRVLKGKSGDVFKGKGEATGF